MKLTKVVFTRTPALATLMRVGHRAVLKRLVAVSDVVEEVEFIFGCEERCTNRVHGGIAPALVVEATSCIKGIEELSVRLGTPEVEVTDLEV